MVIRALVALLATASPAGAAGRPLGRFRITAYCNCRKCCGKAPSHPAYGITASGQRARWGVIVADWSVLPRGTRVRLACLPGTFIVLDKGGAIKGRRIDVWFSSHAAALRFGIHHNTTVWGAQARSRHPP